MDVNNFNQTQTIDIYIDGVKTYSGISANADRPDVANYYNNPAARYHGFNYTFPSDAPWKNGQNHTISVRMCGVNSDLAGSPRTANGCSGGTPNPPSSSCGTGSGLTGFYTNSTDLSTNLVSIRTDAQIDFIWGNDSPIPNVVNADGFSVRWYGQIEAPVSGNYTFKTNNDDGTRVWVNGQIIIDDWNGHAPTWQQGSIYLNAGQKYYINVVFVDYWGGAQAQLFWEYPGQTMQLVPSCRLYTPIIPTQYNPDEIANITNSPLPYGFSSVSLTNLTFFLQSYTGNVVDIVYTPPYEPDPEDPIDPIFHPSSNYPTLPYGGSSGGGSIPGPWNNPGVPRFNIQTGLTAKEIALNRFYANMLYKGISFTTDEKALISQYPDLISNISVYVNIYGSKPYSLKYLSLNVNSVSDSEVENAIANLLDPGVPQGLTPLENQMLGLGTPNYGNNLRQYYKNARSASIRCILHYGYHNTMEIGINVANAFKHALLFIIHSISPFGRTFAKQLVDAHESNSPLIDGDMDRWNNNQGFIIYDADPNRSITQFDQVIWDAVNNGLMRYLVQRMINGQLEWVLIPTNEH
ncbi:hypothetical protein GCM10028774_08850 [Spirosoma jeollabukense]